MDTLNRKKASERVEIANSLQGPFARKVQRTRRAKASDKSSDMGRVVVERPQRGRVALNKVKRPGEKQGREENRSTLAVG